jgi:hypothetical protein
MEQGAEIDRGAPAEILSHPRVVASYLGTNEPIELREPVGTAGRVDAAPELAPFAD